ncbi:MULTISPECIES: RNase adapter RapZ [unclassified Roseivivax]|uniref:RNase adapter RapZ n=1 Tax=Roseivivax sp. GX 12232 TaxID=2900547 RepID=UPI001E5BD445|nr:RNase adapter RapZ [Roseivivax sp. GX 12232]MCE0505736.1 RNase adapter RapZ [Roseivivax sp. GX 12232]
MTDDSQTPRVILLTGPSGAGRTTAINALEDFGVEAIDNIPLSLIPRLLEAPIGAGGIALGVDVRNRDFAVPALLDLVAALRAREDVRLELLFVDCSREVLIRRFSETRRRHPLSPDASPEEGIDEELALLDPVRAAADSLIDTSATSPHDLRAEVARRFTAPEEARLTVSLVSFSYKRGLPQGADMIFDCRFLRNPHWDTALRSATGLSAQVQDYIAEDARLAPFLERIGGLLRFLLPAHREEGKTHVTVGIGCTGGQHRSVAVTESLAGALAESGWQVSISHRELERRGILTPGRDRLADGGKDGSQP